MILTHDGSDGRDLGFIGHIIEGGSVESYPRKGLATS